MVLKRDISGFLKRLLKTHNVIILSGPAGSGKTILAKELFKKFDYFSYDRKNRDGILSKNMTTRLIGNSSNIILDEVPEDYNINVTIKKFLLSHKLKKKVIIISSTEDNKLSSLAKMFPDNVGIAEVLPLSHYEINRNLRKELSLDIVTFYGGISGSYENSEYFREYVSNYFSQIFKKEIFGKTKSKNYDKIILLIKYLAEHVGEVLNFNPLAISMNTNYRKLIPLLSLLVKCRIVFFLPAFEESFGRRVISFPRVYFYDTSLAAYFNGINSSYQLSTNKCRDQLVKNFMLLEIMKSFFNKGLKPDFFFWKEVLRTDIDCIINLNGKILPVVFKSDSSPYNKIISGSRVFSELSGLQPEQSCILYEGKKSCIFRGFNLVSYRDINKIPEYLSFE